MTNLLKLEFLIIFFAAISFCQTKQVDNYTDQGKSNGDSITVDSMRLDQMIPLIDMKNTDIYKGQQGGLYGNGSNEIPSSHFISLETKINEIKPIDGKIGLLSIGMSNTAYEFKYFMRLVQNDQSKSEFLYLCNGAQGGVTADAWADSTSRAWTVLEQRLSQKRLTYDQVQIIWLKTAHRQPKISMPDSNSDAAQLERDITSIIKILKEKFVNLKVIYLSSRIYAGYATSDLNPEPFAYESGFAVRNVILEQINGNRSLDLNTTPVLVWGPYLWTNGENKNSTGLNWSKSDYDPKDFTHPGRGTGIEKVGRILYEFFSTDALAKKFYYFKY